MVEPIGPTVDQPIVQRVRPVWASNAPSSIPNFTFRYGTNTVSLLTLMSVVRDGKSFAAVPVGQTGQFHKNAPLLASKVWPSE